MIPVEAFAAGIVSAVPRGTPAYEEFRQRLRNNYAAWDTRDADRAAPFYTPERDMVFYDALPPVESHNGWDQIREEMQKGVLDRLAELTQAPNNDLRVWRAGDVAWTTNSFVIRGVLRDGGKPVDVTARHTFIWERGPDGTWRELHEHASVPLDPDAAPVPADPARRAPGSGDPELRALTAAWFATWSRLDPNAAERFYATDEDLVFILPGAPLMGHAGWAQLKAAQRRSMGALANASFVPNDDVRAWRRGDLGWSTATFRMAMTPKGGEETAADARVTLIWARLGGGWRVVHEHLSLPTPL